MILCHNLESPHPELFGTRQRLIPSRSYYCRIFMGGCGVFHIRGGRHVCLVWVRGSFQGCFFPFIIFLTQAVGIKSGIRIQCVSCELGPVRGAGGQCVDKIKDTLAFSSTDNGIPLLRQDSALVLQPTSSAQRRRVLAPLPRHSCMSTEGACWEESSMH